MRFGFERLGGLVREKMQAEPRSRALFVFVGKRGHTMKVLTWGRHRRDPDPQAARRGEVRVAEAGALRRPARGRERRDLRGDLQGRERYATRPAAPNALSSVETFAKLVLLEHDDRVRV
jgi:hypothetical protein